MFYLWFLWFSCTQWQYENTCQLFEWNWLWSTVMCKTVDCNLQWRDLAFILTPHLRPCSQGNIFGQSERGSFQFVYIRTPENRTWQEHWQYSLQSGTIWVCCIICCCIKADGVFLVSRGMHTTAAGYWVTQSVPCRKSFLPCLWPIFGIQFYIWIIDFSVFKSA